ncbi:hypothetical protein C8R47DRAFT_1169914 [Mycena vitilis]|nr:hypothetical protein C8R47DRAFT_1169914 [Mycena vitilis]
MQPGPSSSVADFLEELCTRHEAEMAATAEKMRLKEKKQGRRRPRERDDSAYTTPMTTRSRRDTEENDAFDNVRRAEDILHPDDGDADKMELCAQRGRSPVRDTRIESNRLSSPRLRPRASSCPPIPRSSETVVRFAPGLTAMAIRHQPAGATRELSREGSIKAVMPPRQESCLRKRPAPPPEGTDTTLASSGPSAVSGVATRASKRRRLDSTPGTSREPPRCPPSPSLPLSTLTPPPPELLPVEVCSNCRSTVVPEDGWRKSPGDSKANCKLCINCYQYEWKHRESRPLELEMKRSRRGVKKCAHCGFTSARATVRWEFSKLNPGSKLCHRCAQYEREHKEVRPTAVFQCSEKNGPKPSSSRLRRSPRSG